MVTNPNDPAFAHEGASIAIASEFANQPDIRNKIVAIKSFHEGLTKREFFAAIAMQGIITSPKDIARRKDQSVDSFIMCLSVAYADALIAELSK